MSARFCNDDVMLVNMSVKKKWRNLTRPNGAIKIFYMVLRICIRPALYKMLNGFKHINAKTTIQMIENVAVTFSSVKLMFSFSFAIYPVKQKSHTKNIITAILYN